MKKNLYITIGSIVGAVVIVAALIAGIIFVVRTCDEEPAPTEFTLEGTWRLFNYDATTTDVQFLVFGAESVTAFKNGNQVFTSKYEYANNSLKLVDLNKEYVSLKYTNNYVNLVDGNHVEQTLVRSTGNGSVIESIDWTKIVGTWKVTLHGKDFPANETMSFDGSTFKAYRGSETPFVDCPYTPEANGNVNVQSMGQFCLTYVDSNVAILVQLSNGNVFELVPQN